MTNAPLCDPCNASGLPILPVRYAPVPKTVAASLPDWATADRVKDITLDDEYQYALRAIRAGYVYLFFSKNAFGSDNWECYVATGDGHLLKQVDPLMASRVPGETVACARQGHTMARLRHIVIERPEKCGPAWIAFSEHKWSAETIRQYTVDTRLRNARMQTLHPAEMASGAKHSHGALASPAVLEQVVDYAGSDALAKLPFRGVSSVFSKESGRFDAGQLHALSTIYPWCARQGQAAEDVHAMHRRAEKADGTHHTAHLLALWDAVGIAKELNGWRNEAAGWLKKYGDERELEISALQSIEGLQQALNKKITDGWDETALIHSRQPDYEENGIRSRAVMSHAKGDPAALGQPLAALDNQYKSGGIPQSEYHEKRSEVIAAHSSDPAAMEAAYEEIDRHRHEVARARAKNLAGNKQVDYARRWEKYSERLNQPAIRHFKEQFQSMLTQADAIIDRRTQALVNWLEAPLLIDTLEDFHPSCDGDGVQFEDTVGDLVFGMGSCHCGAQKLDEWVKEAKASVKDNLLWRAIALTQHEGAAEIDAALKLAFGPPAPLSVSAFEDAANQIKWNKIFDIGKKSLTLFNTQMKALNDVSSGIAAVPKTRGLEKIFLTLGGRWLQPFKWTVDTVNEKILQVLLQVRSGVDPLRAKALAAWEAAHDAPDRTTLIRRLKNQDFYLSEAAKADLEAKTKKWKELVDDVEVPDAKRKNFNAARDSRLALVVAAFEAFNLYKTRAQAAAEPGNEKVQAQLVAAQLGTTAAVIDVVSNMVKWGAALGDKAVSYQVLKFGGGMLSVVASSYAAVADFGAMHANISAKNYRLGVFFFIRGAFQAVGAGLTLLTAFSYCSPLIALLGKRIGDNLAGRYLARVAARLLLARTALVLASLEVSIFVLFVTVVLWYFEDDALQKWCDRCAYDVRRTDLDDKYTNARQQLDAYRNSLDDAL